VNLHGLITTKIRHMFKNIIPKIDITFLTFERVLLYTNILYV